MSGDQEHQDHLHREDAVEADELISDDEEEEEIPTTVMIALIVLAVGIAIVYLTIGGGHNHFH